MTNHFFFTIHNLSHQSCSKAVTQKVILEFFLRKKDCGDNYRATTFTTTLLWSTVSGGEVKMITTPYQNSDNKELLPKIRSYKQLSFPPNLIELIGYHDKFQPKMS